MKKLTFLIALLCCLATSAQSITEKQLEGSWHICAFDINGVTWDFDTDVIALPEEYNNTLGESQKQAMIADVREGLAVFKNGTVLFKGNYIEQSMAGNTGSGTYTFDGKDGRQFLKITNDDTTHSVDTVQIAIVNGRLHFTVPDEIGGTTLLIYCR